MTGGSIVLNGAKGRVEISSLAPNSREIRAIRGARIALIFQEPMSSLSPVRTIGAQIIEVLRLHRGMDRRAARAATIDLLRQVEIANPETMVDRYTFEFSGGMRQRAMIAMALACDPEVLIADEPTTALDVTTQAEIMDLIKRLQVSRGMAMLLITHDLGLVAETADDVAVMRFGKIVEQGTVDQIFHAPQHPYSRALLASTLKLEQPARTAPVADGAPILQVRNLTKAFGSTNWLGRTVYAITAVDDVSFDLHQGENLGIVGESGSGKTTLGRMLLRTTEPTSGKITCTLDGTSRDVTRMTAAELVDYRRHVRLVFQDPFASLNPRMTVKQVIGDPLYVNGIARGRALEQRVGELMALVGLDPAGMERYPHAFSGGQRQRIGIARALALDPKIVIADEATSALDVSIRSQILDLLLEIQGRLNLSFVFISHDISVIRYFCDRVGVMHRGRIVEIGPTEQNLLDPARGLHAKPHLRRAQPGSAPQADAASHPLHPEPDRNEPDMKSPQVPFGAVYFRKTNPPREDWERDYARAAEDGLNTFRHWFMWSAIEIAPGVYDWDDYDRQLDLAAKHGIGTVIAELTHTVPDWAYRKYAHARQIRANGRELEPIMGVSAATGGFAPNGGGAGSLTMNAPEVTAAVGRFLTALATRYKGHPGLWGYDVWNECNYNPDIDHSAHTKAAFRVWLQAKYGDLKTLGQAWYRYSYAEWDDIEPPREVKPYPQGLDWLQFKIENHYDQMQFKIDTIRAVDADCMIAAHGVAGAVTDLAARGCDDWRAASKVETYGYTWIQGRKGAQPWRNFFPGDLVRGASRGKPFWHAERQGGPLWMQPQVVGRDKEDGRVATPEDIRVWSMSSFAAGARGMLNLRYRPLLDGPLFGAFGSYGMDGAPTPRSELASSMAKWLNAPEQAGLVRAKPVKGDIGLLMIPEAQAWDHMLSHEGGFKTYSEAMWGAYRGFFDLNLQVDWVHVDDIDGYDRLYAPYPIMFGAETAHRLAAWVAAGGTLISEACPGYFGDRGKVGTVQPNNGLDQVFGAREDEVEFMPDIGDRIRLKLEGAVIQGGGFLQSYTLQGGRPWAHFADGRLAAVENTHGKGRTLLVGTHASVGYFRTSGGGYFDRVATWAAIAANVTTSNPTVQARLHVDGDAAYLWIVNPTGETQSGSLLVRGHPANAARILWPADGAALELRALFGAGAGCPGCPARLSPAAAGRTGRRRRAIGGDGSRTAGRRRRISPVPHRTATPRVVALPHPAAAAESVRCSPAAACRPPGSPRPRATSPASRSAAAQVRAWACSPQFPAGRRSCPRSPEAPRPHSATPPRPPR